MIQICIELWPSCCNIFPNMSKHNLHPLLGKQFVSCLDDMIRCTGIGLCSYWTTCSDAAIGTNKISTVVAREKDLGWPPTSCEDSCTRCDPHYVMKNHSSRLPSGRLSKISLAHQDRLAGISQPRGWISHCLQSSKIHQRPTGIIRKLPPCVLVLDFSTSITEAVSFIIAATSTNEQASPMSSSSRGCELIISKSTRITKLDFRDVPNRIPSCVVAPG